MKTASPLIMLTVLADTREQAIPPFPDGVAIERETLCTGDYTTRLLFDFARIERKSLQDLIGSLTHDRERFLREVVRLEAFSFRMVIVEGDLGDIVSHRYRTKAHPNSIIGSVCSLMARYRCPVLFATDPTTTGRMIAGILRRLEDEQRRRATEAA